MKVASLPPCILFETEARGFLFDEGGVFPVEDDEDELFDETALLGSGGAGLVADGLEHDVRRSAWAESAGARA